MVNMYNWFENRIDPFDSQEVRWDNSSSLRILANVIYQSKSIFIAQFVVNLLVATIDASMFVFIGIIVDGLNRDNNYCLDIVTKWWSILVVVLLARPLRSAVATMLSEQSVQAKFSPRVRWKSYKSLMQQSMYFYHSAFAGSLASQTWQSGQSASEFVGSLFQIVLTNFAFIFSVITILSFMDIRLSILVAIWIASFMYVAFKMVPLTRRRARDSAEASATINGHLVDIFGHIHLVRLFAPSATQDESLRKSLEIFIEKSKLFLRAVSTTRIILVALSSCAISVGGVFCLVLWSQGKISAGGITTVIGLLLRLETHLEGVMYFRG
jgi:ATP-binding cassette, subfamily B, multidrug efflux pump